MAPERHGRPEVVLERGGVDRSRVAASRLHPGRYADVPRRRCHGRDATVRRHRVGTGAAVVALTVMASAGHVLYPAWLAWRTRGGRGRVAPARQGHKDRTWPDITVLVPAYREAGVIVRKLEDV